MASKTNITGLQFSLQLRFVPLFLSVNIVGFPLTSGSEQKNH